jgi:hypothetical protein
MEKALLLYAIAEEPIPDHEPILRQILDVADLSQRLTRYESKFSPAIDTFDRFALLITRVIFHFQLNQVLGYVQGPLTTWPVLTSVRDPLLDYALMLGVHRNGLAAPQKVLENIGFETARPLTEKTVWSTVNRIVSTLAPAAASVLHLPRTFCEPNDWREEHEALFTRQEVASDEFIALFHRLTHFGFPETPAGEVDWPRIEKFATLRGLAADAFVQAGQLILRLARNELSESEQSELLGRLGRYGNRVWVTRLRSNARDLAIVRNRVARWTADGRPSAARIRPWDVAPDWWSPACDVALLEAVAEFGQLLAFPWIVDPERPFAARLQADQADEFRRLAAAELETGRAQKPANPGKFGFLLSEKARMGRALAVCQFFETHPRSAPREESSDPEPPETELTELPPLPLDVTNPLIVDQLGAFAVPTAQYPVGFVSRREYFSVVDPVEHCWYESSTEIGRDGKLLYRVRTLLPKGPEYTDHTSSGCWEQVIQDLQDVRARRGLPRRKGTSVSGPWMYGLSAPIVVACFRLMRK